MDWGGCDGKRSEAVHGIYNRTLGVGVGTHLVERFPSSAETGCGGADL